MTFDVVLRVLFTFSLLLLLTRITGKKQLSQSTFFDFVTAIAIGDIAAEKLADPEHPLLPWTVAAVLWFVLIITVDLVVIKNRRLGKLIEGEPVILIENGRILERNLATNFMRVDDLMARLRTQGFFHPGDVEFAVFETDGNISVQPKSQSRPVQPRDLKIPTDYEGMIREVMIEGRPVMANLAQLGLTETWLLAQLARRGHAEPESVFYAALDNKGELYIDTYEDPAPGVRVKPPDPGPH